MQLRKGIDGVSFNFSMESDRFMIQFDDAGWLLLYFCNCIIKDGMDGHWLNRLGKRCAESRGIRQLLQLKPQSNLSYKESNALIFNGRIKWSVINRHQQFNWCSMAKWHDGCTCNKFNGDKVPPTTNNLLLSEWTQCLKQRTKSLIWRVWMDVWGDNNRVDEDSKFAFERKSQWLN